jgi:hypothetical protein
VVDHLYFQVVVAVDDDDSTGGKAPQRLWGTGPAVVVVRRDDDSRPWSVQNRPEALVVVGGSCTSSKLGCYGDSAPAGDVDGAMVEEEDTWWWPWWNSQTRVLVAGGDDRTAYWDATDERPWSSYHWYSDGDDRHAFRGMVVGGEIAWEGAADHGGIAVVADADAAAAGRPSSS